jgi:hypothetical protein
MEDDPVSSPACSSSNDNLTNGNRSPRTSCGGRGSQHRLRFIAAMAAILAVFATGFGVGWYAKGRQCMTSCNVGNSKEEDNATTAPVAASPTREPSNQFNTFVEDDDVSSNKDETEGSVNMVEWSNKSKMCADDQTVRDQLSAAARIYAGQFIDFIAEHFRHGNVSALDEDCYRAVPGFTAASRTATNQLSRLQGRETRWMGEWRQKHELTRATLPNRIPMARSSGNNSTLGDTGGLHEFQEPSAVVSNGEVVFILHGDAEIVAIRATTSAIISRTNVP